MLQTVRALVILAPTLVLLTSVHLLTQATLLDFRPFLNDEVYYWHQIATAADVGINGGYYSVDERTPPVSVFHFGPHGPVYPLLVGLVARLTGWHRASGPLFNITWISICLAAFIAMARLPARRLWLVAIFIATCWPLPFWAASSMQESFHHGVAILLAGIFIAIVRGGRGALLAGWIVLLAAMLIRPSWGVVLPSLCVMSIRDRTPARLALAVVVAAVLTTAVIVAYIQFAAPLPGAFEFLHLASFQDGLAPIVTNTRANLARLANLGDDYDPLEILHRAEYLILTAALLGAAWWWRRRESSEERTQVFIQATQLTGIVLAMVLTYVLTNWTEHRIISAHVLFAALVLSTIPGRFGPVMTLLLVATNVLALPVYAESFRQNRSDNFSWDRRPLRVFEETIGDRLRYVPGASPWCNTILSAQYPPDFIAIPRGIGISITRRPDEFPGVPRSRYLLLDERALAVFAGRIHIEPIGPPLSYGRVYLNVDAHCPR